MATRISLLIGALFLFVFTGPARGASFKRADANLDQLFDISDPVKTLGVLFTGDERPGCDDAMDSNDDGVVDITDGIYSLASLFTGGPDPKPPYPACGADPVSDALGCDRYPGCEEPECLDQEGLDQAILENVPREVCIPADAAVIPVPALSVVVTVCPADQAKPCGPLGDFGCLVDLTTVQGAIDLPGRKMTVHVEGHLEDFPISIQDSLGLNDPVLCTFDVDFKADVVIRFTVEAGQGGEVILQSILDPTIENIDLQLEPSPGFLCAVIASQKEQFVDQLRSQLEEAAKGLLEELRAEFVGMPFC